VEGIIMKCPKCQFENPDGVNFCVECGSKLEILCPECGYGNSLSHKFCGGCGHKLSLPVQALPKDLSFDEKLTKIQRYLPKGLTEKILSQKDRIEGERKHVTVMFCDMEGFTQLSEKLGPEEAYTIMDQVYEILIHKVHGYEGTVNEFTGDGIMALFGAPIALEDAPQRAIRSAYAIHREMTKFSDKMKQEKENIPPLKLRIGIHTGPVVVGTLGNDLRVEFKAVGDTVNLASRMEGLAVPGATFVTEETFKLTEGIFRFEALGKKEVKGKEETVNVYRVIAPSSRRTRFDVSAERGLTRFVGRDRDLELLLDGFERVGKSRILYEFRKAVTNENVTFLEGKCFSYSRGVAYHPVIDILKANFDIQEGDEDSEIREKVNRGLNILHADEASTFSYLLEVLSVKESGLDDTQVTPEAKKAGIMEALNHIVLKGSEIRPLIMAFEDLHWIDKSSEDVLKGLLECIPGARVLLIFTYRPEFAPTWGGRSYHSQVNLNRLPNRECLLMVSHLLGTENIEGTLEEFILEKTEGVPFFIEEFVKSLKELRIVEKEDKKYHLGKNVKYVTIPSTIQDVLMARVDSLPDGAKEVLQTGSVIEREFSYEIIKRLMALPEQELLSHLSILKDLELLYERGIFPQSIYVFKHALTREVVYNSLLLKRRTEIHEAIGKIIEELYRDRLEEFYETLAYHSFRGEDWERANNYNREAGLKAHSFSAYEEAQSYFEASLEALKKLPRTRDRILQDIDIRFNMRAALFPLGRHDEWANHVRKAEVLAKEIVDNTRLANSYNFLSTHYWIRGQHSEAISLCEEGLGLAESSGDFSVYITTMFHLGIPLLYTGEYKRQVKLHREVAQRLSGTAAFERYGLAGLPSVLARSFLSWGLAELGEFEEAEEWGQ
jgi:class 3 adenylate cyclase/tetratricopeptide (TPR) repeat protein